MTGTTDYELTDEQKAMLDFEGQWFKFAGTRETEIRERFGISTTVYAQRVLQLLERPAALAYAPLTVKRLIRLRDRRRSVRTAG